MKKKKTWSSMTKRSVCILTALCVAAAAVPGTGGYNYNEVFAAEEADENMFLMFMETSEVFGEGFRSSSD